MGSPSELGHWAHLDLRQADNYTSGIFILTQTEEEHFHVEEYYQTRFEVNVTIPAFYFDSDNFIYGTVMANYTSGAPVRGNLTLKETFRPLRATPLIPDKPGSFATLSLKEISHSWKCAVVGSPHTREGSEVLQDVSCLVFFWFFFSA